MTFFKSNRGASMLETSLALPIVLFLFLGAVDILRYAYQLSAARYAVNEAASWASNGDTIAGAADNRNIVKSRVIEYGLRVGVNINIENIKICSLRSNNCEDTEDLQPGELFSIEVAEPMRLLTLFGFSRNLNVEASDKVSGI